MTTHQTRAGLDRPADKNRDGLLRLALKLDGVASGALGVLTLLAAGTVVGGVRPFVSLLGIPLDVMVSVGVFLAVFGLLVWGVGSRRKINRPAAGTVVAINALWVLLSVALVLAGAFPLTTLGIVFVLVQAAAVALFADLQFVGLRRSRTAAR